MSKKICSKCFKPLAAQYYQVEVLRIRDEVGITEYTGRLELCHTCISLVTVRKAITRWGFQYK